MLKLELFSKQMRVEVCCKSDRADTSGAITITGPYKQMVDFVRLGLDGRGGMNGHPIEKRSLPIDLLAAVKAAFPDMPLKILEGEQLLQYEPPKKGLIV